MADIFLKTVNMSISAGWIVLAVLLLRLILKRAPKWINCVLWGIVGLRLVMPFSFESIFSLIPSTETISKAPDSPRPHIESGVTVVDETINAYLKGTYFEGVTKSTGYFTDVTTIMAVLWLAGIIVLMFYAVISYFRLHIKVGTAVLLRDNVYQCEAVISPFVLGIIRPKIYLPFSISEKDVELVISHETAHIRRKDHLLKPLGFMLLSLHWFNPFLWIGYGLLCRDIELACDEKVVKEFTNTEKADYSQALLNCSVNRRLIAACPLAFGETGVKNRVKAVLSYKKPAVIIIILAVTVCVIFGAVFLTNPVSEKPLLNSEFETGRCLYSFVVSENKETEINEVIYNITEDGEVYKSFDEYTHDFLGLLTENNMSVSDLEKRFTEKKIDFGSVTKVYFVTDTAGTETVFMQNSRGTVFAVSFFSDGSVMSVFKLKRLGKCNTDVVYPESTVNNARTLKELKDKYPEFFNLSTDGGLTVYIWQMSSMNYRCYLANSVTEAFSDNSFAYTTGATVTEMRIILSSYNIKKEDVTVMAVTNPLSSYYYVLDKEYQKYVKEMFWQEEPEKTTIKEGSVLNLDAAINKVLDEKYSGSAPEGLVNIQSYYLFANEVAGPASSEYIEEITVYIVVYQMNYSIDTKIVEVEGSFIPTVMTFMIDENGVYTLKDYRTPRKGEHFEEDVREIFLPSIVHYVLDEENYSEALIEDSLFKASEYLKNK